MNSDSLKTGYSWHRHQVSWVGTEYLVFYTGTGKLAQTQLDNFY